MRSLIARLGFPSFTSATAVAGVCTAGACAGMPLLFFSPLVTSVLGISVFWLSVVVHVSVIFLIPPLNLVLLWRSFTRHHDPKGLFVAGIGLLLIFAHGLSHFHHGTYGDEPLMYAGLALLLIGALLDWRAQRQLVYSQ